MISKDSPQQTSSLTVEQALRQAIAHHQTGQLQDAERLYRAILQVRPDHPDANHNLGVLAIQVKRPAAGLPHFKVALEANPKHGQYSLSYAKALLLTGQTKDALDIIQKAIQRGLNTTAAQELLQEAGNAVRSENATDNLVKFEQLPQTQTKLSGAPLAELQDREANVRISESFKKGKSTSKMLGPKKLLPQAEINRLVGLFNAGHYVELESRAHLLVEQYPDFGFPWKVLGIALQAQEKNALPAMKRATELSPDDADAHYNLGNILKALGQLDEAVVSYRRALEIKPDHTEAHYNLGITLQLLGQLSNAVVSYRRALEIKPNYAEVHYNLGIALQLLGQLDKAVASYRCALEINANYADAYSNLGNALQDLGQLDDAAASYHRALEIKPDHAGVHNNLGNVLRDLGQLDDAAASYRRALEIKPDHAGAHNNLGNILQDLGQLDDAVASYRQALKIKPDFIEAQCNLGNAFVKLDYLDDAEASFRRVLEIKPDFVEAHNSLCALIGYMGDLDREISVYQKTFTIDPQGIGLAAAVMLAVHRYFSGDYLECRSLLLESQMILAKSDAKFSSPSAYWKLLDLLLLWNQKTNGIANSPKNVETLYVIGESHSLPAHGTVVSYRERHMRCVAQLIVGCKQWHLGNGKANKYRRKFEKIMAGLPQRSVILMTIGEIDCRHDEGISRVWRKSPEKSLDSLCLATSKAYLEYVTEVGARYGHQLIISGVPAPNISLEALTRETAKQHISFIRTFNTILSELVLASGMDSLDIYSLTNRGDGVASGERHIDKYHLLPSAVAEAFDKYCLRSE